MNAVQDWLWDRKITPQQARVILRNPENKHFLSLSSALLSRKNQAKDVFRNYLKAPIFLRYWKKIKQQMRKNYWNDPRIEFWQAVYEKLREKYKGKNIGTYTAKMPLKPEIVFCREVADKIKSIRKQKGLTQNELARKLRISQQVISRIESGKENISLITLKKIATGLGAKLQIEINA